MKDTLFADFFTSSDSSAYSLLSSYTENATLFSFFKNIYACAKKNIHIYNVIIIFMQKHSKKTLIHFHLTKLKKKNVDTFGLKE